MAKNNMTPQERQRVIELAISGRDDAAIMALTGRSLAAIKRTRLKAGINRAPRFPQPTPGQIEELRHTSDRAMARKYHNDHRAWGRFRLEQGIPRFRAPTTGKDAPPPVVKVKTPAAGRSYKEQGQSYRSIFANQPTRDYSPVTEAQRFLQSEGWMVVNRAKVYGAPGWAVGRMVLTEEAMLEMASRKGFEFKGYV